MENKKNFFVLGMNELNHEWLKSIQGADHYRFFGIIPPGEAEDADQYDVNEMLERVRGHLKEFPDTIDGIVSYIDFPISGFVPILCKEYGLPGPSLESILKCQHKFWFRKLAREAVPENNPRFALVDPFEVEEQEDAALPYPFWLKPVKSVGSNLGFKVKTKKGYQNALARIREGIGRLAGPFEQIMEKADLPEDIKNAGGGACIAESLIGGKQCTLEGYVFNGTTTVYGVVDSIREKNGSTFSRYQYPSKLPVPVQNRMVDITRKMMEKTGMDNTAFNVEFFWNQSKDQVWLLEVNTRISQSHCDLFHKVDGASHHQVMVDLGLGKDPDFPHRKGKFRMAGKFFLRLFRDAYVTRVPSRKEIEKVREEIPGLVVSRRVDAGMWLSELNEQDSYSYELAWLFIGGKDQKDLLKKYRYACDHLPFRFMDEQMTDVLYSELPAEEVSSREDLEKPIDEKFQQ